MSVLIDRGALLAAANNLAPLPNSTARLAALSAQRDWDIKEVVNTVAFDPVLTARVLRGANSAASATISRITTVQDAVVRLGIGRVASLAIGSHVKEQMKEAVPEYGIEEGQLWQHSIATALTAELAAAVCKTNVPQEAFTAALLHDMGKLVLSRTLAAPVLNLLREAREKGIQESLQAEKEILGLQHGELGGLMAQHWNLPKGISTGISNHHHPDGAHNVIADLIHLGDVVSRRIGIGQGAQELSEKCVVRLGIKAGGVAKLSDAVWEKLDEILAVYD